MRKLVSLPGNCGTNPVWSDWSCYTETTYPGLFSVSFLMDPYLLPLVIHCLLHSVPNTHNSKRGRSYFKPRNPDGRTQNFASLNMDLEWRWDDLLFQDLNKCCKGDRTSGNMVFSFCSCVRLFDSFIYSCEEIGTNPISVTLLALRNSLVTVVLFPLKNLMMYSMLSV